MLNIAEIKGNNHLEAIYFDMDDSGHFFIKQDSDWIELNALMLAKLCQAIEKQLERL